MTLWRSFENAASPTGLHVKVITFDLMDVLRKKLDQNIQIRLEFTMQKKKKCFEKLFDFQNIWNFWKLSET